MVEAMEKKKKLNWIKEAELKKKKSVWRFLIMSFIIGNWWIKEGTLICVLDDL